jgi:hypothetical protein
MNAATRPTAVQQWLRNYSKLLQVSFESSAEIQHCVRKGESREWQILDTLEELLPTRFSVERRVVILDSTDRQSPAFDGALVDRGSWPRVFTDGVTSAVMIESVLAALEVKSRLDSTDLEDILKKAAALRRMRRNTDDEPSGQPFVTGFAYGCDNLNLSFFDFAAAFVVARELSPSLVCVLDLGLFGLAESVGGRVVPVADPSARAFPILYVAGEDSLLVYLYFLSEWAGMETRASHQFRRYSESLFSGMTCFRFDADFLERIDLDEVLRKRARQSFLRKPNADVAVLYANARKALRLPPS